MSIKSAIAAGFTPYITSDLILSVLVAVTSLYVIPAIRKAGFKKEAC